MKVMNVVLDALYMIGRYSLAPYVAVGGSIPMEDKELVDMLVFCCNAVEDELSRKYFPLTATEELTSDDGKFYYTQFERSPVRIKRVLADGKDIRFGVYATYVEADAKKITVEYDYASKIKNIQAEIEVCGAASDNLMALGTVAEYCLINGEIEAYELWEKRYREQIDLAQKALPSGGAIPPRRWV